MSNVLIKIYCHDNKRLFDHRIISKNDADKLSQFWADHPDLLIELRASYVWEEYIHDLRLEIISDSAVVNAFHLVYPDGILSRPIYEDIISCDAFKKHQEKLAQ